MGKYERKIKRRTKWLYYTALAVLLLIFFISGCLLLQYWLQSRAARDHYEELSSMVDSIQQEQATQPDHPDQPSQSNQSDPSAPSDPPGLPSEPAQTDAAEPGILPEYAAVYERNEHMVGWIRIEGTVINYPVLQTPQEPDYYLRRNFDRNYSTHGSIYADEPCDVNEPSDNVTLYGHFMRDGSMFADLDKYLDKYFWEEYPYIQFDTLTEHRTYEIFSIFKTTASVGEGFEYHNFIHAATQEDFDWFIRQCKNLGVYDTGITPTYGDKIICLSTCEYSAPNGRLVVAARLIEE